MGLSAEIGGSAGVSESEAKSYQRKIEELVSSPLPTQNGAQAFFNYFDSHPTDRAALISILEGSPVLVKLSEEGKGHLARYLEIFESDFPKGSHRNLLLSHPPEYVNQAYLTFKHSLRMREETALTVIEAQKMARLKASSRLFLPEDAPDRLLRERAENLVGDLGGDLTVKQISSDTFRILETVSRPRSVRPKVIPAKKMNEWKSEMVRDLENARLENLRHALKIAFEKEGRIIFSNFLPLLETGKRFFWLRDSHLSTLKLSFENESAPPTKSTFTPYGKTFSTWFEKIGGRILGSFRSLDTLLSRFPRPWVRHAKSELQKTLYTQSSNRAVRLEWKATKPGSIFEFLFGTSPSKESSHSVTVGIRDLLRKLEKMGGTQTLRFYGQIDHKPSPSRVAVQMAIQREYYLHALICAIGQEQLTEDSEQFERRFQEKMRVVKNTPDGINSQEPLWESFAPKNRQVIENPDLVTGLEWWGMGRDLLFWVGRDLESQNKKSKKDEVLPAHTSSSMPQITSKKRAWPRRVWAKTPALVRSALLWTLLIQGANVGHNIVKEVKETLHPDYVGLARHEFFLPQRVIRMNKLPDELRPSVLAESESTPGSFYVRGRFQPGTRVQLPTVNNALPIELEIEGNNSESPVEILIEHDPKNYFKYFLVPKGTALGNEPRDYQVKYEIQMAEIAEIARLQLEAIPIESVLHANRLLKEAGFSFGVKVDTDEFVSPSKIADDIREHFILASIFSRTAEKASIRKIPDIVADNPFQRFAVHAQWKKDRWTENEVAQLVSEYLKVVYSYLDRDVGVAIDDSFRRRTPIAPGLFGSHESYWRSNYENMGDAVIILTFVGTKNVPWYQVLNVFPNKDRAVLDTDQSSKENNVTENRVETSEIMEINIPIDREKHEKEIVAFLPPLHELERKKIKKLIRTEKDLPKSEGNPPSLLEKLRQATKALLEDPLLNPESKEFIALLASNPILAKKPFRKEPTGLKRGLLTDDLPPKVAHDISNAFENYVLGKDQSSIFQLLSQRGYYKHPRYSLSALQSALTEYAQDLQRQMEFIREKVLQHEPKPIKDSWVLVSSPRIAEKIKVIFDVLVDPEWHVSSSHERCVRILSRFAPFIPGKR